MVNKTKDGIDYIDDSNATIHKSLEEAKIAFAQLFKKQSPDLASNSVIN